jgi:hypothetical protein
MDERFRDLVLHDAHRRVLAQMEESGMRDVTITGTDIRVQVFGSLAVDVIAYAGSQVTEPPGTGLWMTHWRSQLTYHERRDRSGVTGYEFATIDLPDIQTSRS